MAYWSIALLLLSVSFLAIRHPQAAFDALPRWLRRAKRRPDSEEKDEPPGSPRIHPAENGHVESPEVIMESDEPSESESTPKAGAIKENRPVPTFSLDDGSNADTTEQKGPALRGAAPSFPAANSAQRIPSMMPPPKPATPRSQQSSGTLMPPPPRPTATPSLNSTSALPVPSSGPLPNRGPPPNSQQRAFGGLTVNGAVSTPNPRGKVLLSPGHSPMDWAALTRSSKNKLSGVSTFQRVTPSQLKSMTGRKGKPAWSSWQGRVYNLTPYLPFHPGGEAEMMKAAGRDGTKLFMEVHPWVNWENMLGACLVGVMVPEQQQESPLEAMD